MLFLTAKSLLGDASSEEVPKRTHSGPKERTTHPLDGAKSGSSESLTKSEGKGYVSEFDSCTVIKSYHHSAYLNEMYEI